MGSENEIQEFRAPGPGKGGEGQVPEGWGSGWFSRRAEGRVQPPALRPARAQGWAQRLRRQKRLGEAGGGRREATPQQVDPARGADREPLSPATAFREGPGSLATAKRKREGGAAERFRGARLRLSREGCCAPLLGNQWQSG